MSKTVKLIRAVALDVSGLSGMATGALAQGHNLPGANRNAPPMIQLAAPFGPPGEGFPAAPAAPAAGGRRGGQVLGVT